MRYAPWLTANRARAWGNLFAVFMLLLTTGFYAHILAAAFGDPGFRPLASDFDAFWSGAHLAAAGRPQDAYDLRLLGVTEAAGAQTLGQLFYYLYPPVWLLLCLPLGVLPYIVALPVFLLSGYAAMVAWLRCLLPRPWPILTVLAFPAALLNAVIGQNGFVTAGCFAGGMLWLERRPGIAGMCLGLLVIKPHLAVGVPVALLAARRWRALGACALTAMGVLALSWAVLGTAAWMAFLAASSFIGSRLFDPGIARKLISVFEGVRLLGGGAALAAVAQAVAASLALACVARVAWRRPGAGPEIAMLVTASMLCTPYLMDYDLVCLGVPMAWLASCGVRRGWRPWEKSLLALLYVLPVVVRHVNIELGVPVGPVALAGMMAVTWARGKAVLI